MEFFLIFLKAHHGETRISTPLAGVNRKGRKSGGNVCRVRIVDDLISELHGRGSQPENTHEREKNQHGAEDFSFFEQTMPQSSDKILDERDTRSLTITDIPSLAACQVLLIRNLLP